MATSKVVGKVSVKVYPDTKHFRRDLERFLNRWETREKLTLKFDTEVNEKQLKQEALRKLRDLNKTLKAENRKIQFHAEISATGLSASVKTARKNLQKQATAWTKAHPIKFAGELDIVNVDVDKSSMRAVEQRLKDWVRDLSPLKVGVAPELVNGTSSLVAARLTYLTRPRTVAIAPVLEGTAVAKVATALAALSGGRAVWNLGDSLITGLKDIDKAVPKIAAVSTALINLAAYTMTAASNVLTFGASLASIAPVALTLPGILGGMAVGMGATYAALKDFNKILPEVSGQFHEMQDVISARFWAQAEAPMRRFFGTMMPLFTRNLGATGDALGTFFGQFSDSMTGVFDGEIEQMFRGLNMSIQIASTYTDKFAGVIATLGSVGAANLPRLATWFGETATTFDNWLNRAESDGRLQGWVDTGIEALSDLGVVLRETGSTFAGLARAMERAGGSTLDKMADTMESVSDTVNSPRFQTALTKAFRGAHEAMSEIANHSGKQFEGLMIRVSDLFATTLPTAGRTAGKALGAVFDALDQPRVVGAISGFFDHIESAVDNLAPTMPALARALASVVDVVGVVAESISKVLAPAIENLAPKVEEVAEIIEPFAELLGDVLGPAVDGLTTLLGKLPPELLIAGGAFLALRKSSFDMGGAMAVAGTRITAAQTGITTFAAGIRALPRDINTMATTWATAGARTQRETERMNTALGRTQATLTRLRSVVAGGAGLAAFGLVASGAADKVGLANSASMGLMGLMAGGPWGAAIGGAIGLVMDFASVHSDLRTQMQETEAVTRSSTATLEERFSAVSDQIKMTNDTWSDLRNINGFGDAMSDIVPRASMVIDKLAGVRTEAEKSSDAARENAKAFFDLVNVLDSVGTKIDGFGDRNLDDGGLSFSDDFFSQWADDDFMRGLDLVEQNFAEIQERLTLLGPAMERTGIGIEDLMNPDTDSGAVTDELVAMHKFLQTTDGKIDGVTQAFGGFNDELSTASSRASDLNSALTALLNPQMSATDAAIQWREALRGLTGEIKTAKDLNGFTAAADQNKQSVLGMVTSLQEVLVANANAGDSQRQLTRQLIDGRKAIIDNAASTREGKRAVSEFLSEMGLAPKLVTSILRTVGVEKSTKQMREFRKIADGLPRKLQTRLETAGFPLTRRQLRELANLYDDQPKKVETLIEAITKGAKVDIKDIDQMLVDLTGGKYQPEVEVKDNSEGTRKKAKDDLVDIDRFFARPSMDVTDRASPILNIVDAKLDGIDGRIANSYVYTHYKTTGNPPGGGNTTSNRTTHGGVDPMNRMVVNTERALRAVQNSFTRFSDAIRNELIQASNRWMNNMRQRGNQVSNAIQNRLQQAQNALRNADTKAEKAAAKRRLKHLQQLAGGWRKQGKEIDKAIRAYERVNNQLQEAVAKLDALKAEIAAYKDALKDSFESWASILNAPMATFSSMVNHLKRRIVDLQAFKDGMEDLTAMGLSQTVIDQLAQAGPDALAFIKSILAQGQAGVDELNDLWGQIDDISLDTADLLGDYQFADELQLAEDAVDAFLHTLQDMQGPINQAANQLLNNIARGAKANRRRIVKEVDAIIQKYRNLLNMMNQATQQNTPGNHASNRAGMNAKNRAGSVHNDNRVFNINLNARTGRDPDLFTAAQTVKAVIASA